MKIETAVYSALMSLGILSSVQASTVIYAEDFSATTLSRQSNPYLGGWFTPQTAFQVWNGPSEASITVGSLEVTSTSVVRTAGILLPPTIFVGAGTYTLSFDVVGYEGSSNNSGLVSVWSGSGYGESNTGNALILDTLNGALRTEGSAVASSLGSLVVTGTGVGQSLTFEYDGTSAVALFMGARTSGWPFPTVKYDNLLLQAPALAPAPVVPVPEPSAVLLVGVAGVAACGFRRRRR